MYKYLGRKYQSPLVKLLLIYIHFKRTNHVGKKQNLKHKSNFIGDGIVLTKIF